MNTWTFLSRTFGVELNRHIDCWPSRKLGPSHVAKWTVVWIIVGRMRIWLVQSVVLCCWQDGSWHFEWCRVWCCVAGRMVPGILKDYSTFFFRGNQSMKNGERLILKMNATQTIKIQKPLAEWHSGTFQKTWILHNTILITSVQWKCFFPPSHPKVL